jgi:hypothetical protein
MTIDHFQYKKERNFVVCAACLEKTFRTKKVAFLGYFFYEQSNFVFKIFL